MALPGDIEFAVRYTKGEEKVCVLDRNPSLEKMGRIIKIKLDENVSVFKMLFKLTYQQTLFFGFFFYIF